MWDALSTAIGKPGSPMKIVLIGTVAPSSTGWWPDLIEAGSQGSTYVQSIQGDASLWDQWKEIRRCNPLWNVDPRFRKRLLLERDEARADSRLKARFLSYRLNFPAGDPSQVLLTVADWKQLQSRAVPERQGVTNNWPLILGGGQSMVGCDFQCLQEWAAAKLWRSVLDCQVLRKQEQRDRVEPGTYQRFGGSGNTANS